MYEYIDVFTSTLHCDRTCCVRSSLVEYLEVEAQQECPRNTDSAIVDENET